jgi:hypothetical protein
MRYSWSVGPREWKTVERFVYWYNFFFCFFFFFYFIILSSSWWNHCRFQDWKKARTFYFLKSKTWNKICLHQHTVMYTQLYRSAQFPHISIAQFVHSYSTIFVCLLARLSLSQSFWNIWRITTRILFDNNHVTDILFSHTTSCMLILYFFIPFDWSIYQKSLLGKLSICLLPPY